MNCLLFGFIIRKLLTSQEHIQGHSFDARAADDLAMRPPKRRDTIS